MTKTKTCGSCKFDPSTTEIRVGILCKSKAIKGKNGMPFDNPFTGECSVYKAKPMAFKSGNIESNYSIVE